MAHTEAMPADTTRRSVLFVGVNYAPEPTGIGPYTTGMATGLGAHDWKVSVITGHPHYPWWRIPEEHRGLPARDTVDGVDVRRVRHFVPKRHNAITRALHEVTFGLRAAFSSWRHADGSRPDVVVLVSPALLSSRIVAVRARARRIPVVTWVQDIYTLGVKEAGGGLGSGVIERFERGLANLSSRVVVIHDRFRRMFAEDLGTTRPIDVVRNWSHVPDLHDRRDAEVRRRHGWEDDDIVVLHAGNMGAKQGLESVVAAGRVAAERDSAVRFVLLGDGNQRATLEELAKTQEQDAGRPLRLQFIDPLDDEAFFALLGSADALLVNERPGLTEMSVPSKMTTYFSTGLPVVAAVDTSSTTHDEMQAAQAGPCVAAADPEALVTAAEAVASDPAAARTYGENGRAYRQRLLTEHAAIARFADVLDLAISG